MECLSILHAAKDDDNNNVQQQPTLYISIISHTSQNFENG
jgi:hypothetical protein